VQMRDLALSPRTCDRNVSLRRKMEDGGATKEASCSSVALAVAGREQYWCSSGGSACVQKRGCSFRRERDGGGAMGRGES